MSCAKLLNAARDVIAAQNELLRLDVVPQQRESLAGTGGREVLVDYHAQRVRQAQAKRSAAIRAMELMIDELDKQGG